MPRIRTIKPEFLRHDLLQDLEVEHPERRPMLVFMGLWTQCDKQGVFEWNERQLALDILPFVWEGRIGEALGKTLTLLGENRLIFAFESGGKRYGYIPTFEKHQRVSGKEKTEPPRNPEPPENIEENNGGSNGEATGKQRGSDRASRKGVQERSTGKDINPLSRDALKKLHTDNFGEIGLTPQHLSVFERWIDEGKTYDEIRSAYDGTAGAKGNGAKRWQWICELVKRGSEKGSAAPGRKASTLDLPGKEEDYAQGF